MDKIGVLTFQRSKQRYEMLKLIRKEKLDLILPRAMRDNKVDMWIPEWGERVSVSYEDDSIITDRGIEALYPWHENILIIR